MRARRGGRRRRASEKESFFPLFFPSSRPLLLRRACSSESASKTEGRGRQQRAREAPNPETRHSTFDTHLPKQNQKKKLLLSKKKNSKTITAWVDLNRQATKVAGNAAPGTPIEKLGDNYVTKVFDQAKDAGFNLVRVFGHGEETSFMLQTSPGNYDERIFRGLDYIIAVAGSRGVRVLFVPINMWLSPHVGDGFGTYVEWAGYPVSQSVSRGFFRFLFPSRAIRTLLLRRRLLLPLSRARARVSSQ
jgi:hypothetical protein